MIEYTAKILKIILLSEYEDTTSPYRESKNLPPSTYDPLIEAEIICVERYNDRIKTSCFTTIGFRSYEEVEKYLELTDIKKDSQELQSVITLYRLKDLRAGELIKFSYPAPKDRPEDKTEDCNLIRYENKILTIEDFKNKSYPSKIDNTLEDFPKRSSYSFVGLSKFEKVRIHFLKDAWFRLQGKYRFLIEVKQNYFIPREVDGKKPN